MSRARKRLLDNFTNPERDCMKTIKRSTLLSVFIMVSVAGVFAQTDSAKPRKFKTTYKINMYEDSDFHSKKITSVPAGVVLDSLEETKRYGGYMKIAYKNKTGWVLKTETQRYMDVPAPELVCFANGYKIIGDVYSNFLVIRNDGTLPYVGSTTLRLFGKDGKIVFERTVGFPSDKSIEPDTGGPFNVDTTDEAASFEFQHETGTIKGNIGDLIERLP